MSARPAQAFRTAAAGISARRFASTTPLPTASSSSLPSPLTPSTDQTRIYGPRKAFLHAYYSHLFKTSELVLLFSHDNLTVANLLAIRRAIAKIPIPEEDRVTLTVARTGLLSSLFRPSSSSSTTTPSLHPHLLGPTALITSPKLSPPYIAKVLSTITRTLKRSQKEAPPNTPPEKVKQPTLKLVAGILEGGRLVGVKEIESVGKLPEMDVLRAQVVGLLEGQGRGLLGVLGQAGGGGLVRTLQGLEAGLKEGEKGEEVKAES